MKNVYCAVDGKVEEYAVVYESDKSFFVYEKEKNVVVGIYKPRVICDNGSFRKIYESGMHLYTGYPTEFSKGPVFGTENLAHEYLASLSKYKDLWDMTINLETHRNEAYRYHEELKRVNESIKIDEDCLRRMKGIND